MNTSSSTCGLGAIAGSLVLSLLALAGLGCDGDPSSKNDGPAKDTGKQVETKRNALDKNVFFEIQGDSRRVVVEAVVCLREGHLEGLLCRKNTKEHEYILSADVDARKIHAGLIAARAKPGSPVKFEPKYEPARGTPIKITLQYEDKGKLVTVPARDWLYNPKTKKNLDVDFVFGGSQFVPDPENKDKPPIYLANYGDIICLVNMDGAMLDIPVRSPKPIEDRNFEAMTSRIPKDGTKVSVILEPLPEKEKPEKDK